jgi:fatty acid desaturase
VPASRPRSDYADLKSRIAAAGLLDAQERYYLLKAVIAVTTLGCAIGLVLMASNPFMLLGSAVLLAFASTQTALLGHDIAHRQAFRGRRRNRVAVLLAANVLVGISHSWWTRSHNAHHAHPNHVDYDPDIQFPMVAFSAHQLAEKHPGLRPFVGWQAVLFPLLFPFQALNMRLTSLRHLASQPVADRPLQIACLSLHAASYGLILWSVGSWPLALAFAATHQLLFGLYNSSVFASNHKGMAMITEDGRLDFLREQVLTARNLRGSRWTDFWYGGLNYQIEHHLFPTMPRNNFRKARLIVRAFCEERGVKYHETGLLASYLEGLRHLHRVSAPARAPASH